MLLDATEGRGLGGCDGQWMWIAELFVVSAGTQVYKFFRLEVWLKILKMRQ